MPGPFCRPTYKKKRPSLAEAMAMLGRCLLSSCHFRASVEETDGVKNLRSLFERLTEAMCDAARRIKSSSGVFSLAILTISSAKENSPALADGG
jgi:hypothetical protein